MIALLFFNHVVIEKRKFSKLCNAWKTNAEYYKGEAFGIRQVEVSREIYTELVLHSHDSIYVY